MTECDYDYDQQPVIMPRRGRASSADAITNKKLLQQSIRNSMVHCPKFFVRRSNLHVEQRQQRMKMPENGNFFTNDDDNNTNDDDNNNNNNPSRSLWEDDEGRTDVLDGLFCFNIPSVLYVPAVNRHTSTCTRALCMTTRRRRIAR
eukprot:CAMPEP_0170177434 /NCGR_PEP_ID=MMETSP0040_2-20121228/10082_1 /TAXON_ID=641309 /ORGANISM="Lotharella oceanica, Strain CCMP622" /LENGTH=145 /DNA_ID=CAMNT_0010420069 /DNA_START=88 /DNA_END=526 /DNA_ORIENTATION=+